MFQLDQSLQEWAGRFDPTQAMRKSDIEELEQHVRDSITELKTKGLGDEEAFLVATHRVGQASSLEREYAKINDGRIRRYHVFWMIAGVLFFEVCRFFITAVASLSEALTASAGGGGAVIGYSSAGVTALLWIGLAFWLYRTSVIRSDEHSIDRLLANTRGKLIGIAIALTAVVSVLTKFGCQMVISYMAPLNDIGEAMIITSLANAFFALATPLAFLFVMLSIRTKMRETSAAEA